MANVRQKHPCQDTGKLPYESIVLAWVKLKFVAAGLMTWLPKVSTLGMGVPAPRDDTILAGLTCHLTSSKSLFTAYSLGQETSSLKVHVVVHTLGVYNQCSLSRPMWKHKR